MCSLGECFLLSKKDLQTTINENDKEKENEKARIEK
jgi:hypothetical protein